MDHPRPTPSEELPSSKQLLRSTGLAVAVAAVLLVTTVLPAEYGIDPTGVGSALGLTRMGQVKIKLADEAAAEAVAPGPPPPAAIVTPDPAPPLALAAAAAPAPTGRKDEVTVTLLPDQAAEVKLMMRGGARATFRWSVTGGHVNYDTHGDPVDNPKGYHGYGKGKGSTGESGVLEAAFDGRHGWYWRNRSGKEVTVTLTTEGDYTQVQRML
jgi:hypothetical protein